MTSTVEGVCGALCIAGAFCLAACTSQESAIRCEDGGKFEQILELVVPPLLYAPTEDGIAINLVFRGFFDRIGLLVHEITGSAWSQHAGEQLADDVIEFRLSGLAPATRHTYRIVDLEDESELFRGEFTTRPERGTSFTFDLLADTHLYVRNFSEEELVEHPLPEENVEKFRHERATALDILSHVAENIAADQPDFIVHLGDVIDFHGFGFNAFAPHGRWTRQGYLSYRELMGDLLGNTAHLLTIGNWEGENGSFLPAEIATSRDERLLYLPSPTGDSPNRDYFALNWGDALIVVLNVMTYTTQHHLLGGSSGRPDDWTLGPEQLTWLEATLAGSQAHWKMICIHHPVGGNGGDYDNSVYGRGGGRAAYVGEQATVHELMLRHRVQVFFYGHDHVVTDMQVDGIHYTLSGSAGAPWLFLADETGYDRFWDEPGHARVSVSPSLLLVELLSITGEVLHIYELE